MILQEFVLLLACIDTVFLIILLALLTYVVVHYIIRLKIKNKFVIVFYLLAFLTIACQIVQSLSIIINWDKTLYVRKDDYTPINTQNVADSLAKVFNTALGLVVIATMFKIAVSMQLILGELTPEARRRKKRRFYIFLSINSVIVIFEAGMVYSQTLFVESTCAWMNAIIYSYLLFLYCVVMYFLMNKLKRVETDEESLKEEKTRITNQFLIFMLAYLTSALFYIFEWLCLERYPSAVNCGKYIIIVFQSILPIAYVIRVHKNVYSKMSNQNKQQLLEEKRGRYLSGRGHQTLVKITQFDLASCVSDDSYTNTNNT